MTLINGIEIDNITYYKNDEKSAIENNEPIEEKLHVIAVVSNPCLYAKRYILMKEFIKRIELEEKNVNLYIVELAYKNQNFIITDKNNKQHLQLRTDCPLWHKENMINLGVKYLLPDNYKAFAWIDADIEFENNTWALDTLKILNGTRDIVQLFSHVVDMDKNRLTMNVFNSAGYQYAKRNNYCSAGGNQNYWHPGYAWAITRKAYEKIGGLYDKGILGPGDNIMLCCLLKEKMGPCLVNNNKDAIQSVVEYEKKMENIKLGYVPGVIRHYYHGSKKNRFYVERNSILVKHNFSPYTDITYDDIGIIIPTQNFSEDFKKDIYNYFQSRNEDE